MITFRHQNYYTVQQVSKILALKRISIQKRLEKCEFEDAIKIGDSKAAWLIPQKSVIQSYMKIYDCNYETALKKIQRIQL